MGHARKTRGVWGILLRRWSPLPRGRDGSVSASVSRTSALEVHVWQRAAAGVLLNRGGGEEKGGEGPGEEQGAEGVARPSLRLHTRASLGVGQLTLPPSPPSMEPNEERRKLVRASRDLRDARGPAAGGAKGRAKVSSQSKSLALGRNVPFINRLNWVSLQRVLEWSSSRRAGVWLFCRAPVVRRCTCT